MLQEVQATQLGFGYKDNYGTGQNGTGGLLILYANSIKNQGNIISEGSNGGGTMIGINSSTAINIYGGSSGGGSINIFYKEKLEKQGNISAKGGYNGGRGSISIGHILSTGAYESTYKNY